MKNIIKPDPLSLTTHHLHICFTETVISSGSGFIYHSKNSFYLITNWHNVSGKNPLTNEYLSEHKSIPDMISTMFREKGNPGTCHRENIKLYTDYDMLNPIWLIHPVYKNKVDVVAIPLDPTLKEKYDLFPINNLDFDSEYPPEVSDDVFIVGYPFSDITYLQMPIWKKGSIASEPNINLDQLPKLLIDTATRPGLSGSPVIYQRVGVHGLENGKFVDNSLIGRIREFLGIYSGRIGKDEFKAQLGIVWKKNVLNEIIESGLIGDRIIS